MAYFNSHELRVSRTLSGEVERMSLASSGMSAVADFQSSELDSMLSKTEGSGTTVLFAQRNILRAFRRMELPRSEGQLVGFFPIEDPIKFVNAQFVVYFLNPDVEQLRSFVIHLLSYTERFPKAKPRIYFVPRKSLMVEHILEVEFKLTQLFADIQFGEVEFDVSVIEDDLLTMFQPRLFRHLFVDNDNTSLAWISKLILRLQTLQYGAIPTIRAKGDKATRVLKMLSGMYSKMDDELINGIVPEVSTLLIMDRTTDLVTPLMTQLTYEGLIDEFYSTESCATTFPFSLGDKTGLTQSKVLDSKDKIFAEIRDKNFAIVGATLYQKSLWVKQHYEKRKEVNQIRELKEYMKCLPEMQELHRQIGLHTTIASEIGKNTQTHLFRRRILVEQNIVRQINNKASAEYIKELIFQKSRLPSVLRLLCLYSVVNGGVSEKLYAHFRESMMLTYGIPEIISVFTSLEAAGLLTLSRSESGHSYPTLRTKFQTWKKELNEQQPNDIAYAYSGYASLLVRMVELLLKTPDTWNATDSALRLVPGCMAEVKNPVVVTSPLRKTIVFVIGGITAAEMSSFRYLQTTSGNTDQRERIVVLSTDITNGNKIVSSALPFHSAI